MSKDYRMWWRVFYKDIDNLCEDAYNEIQYDYEIWDQNTTDCICEQLWAIREELA